MPKQLVKQEQKEKIPRVILAIDMGTREAREEVNDLVKELDGKHGDKTVSDLVRRLIREEWDRVRKEAGD